MDRMRSIVLHCTLKYVRSGKYCMKSYLRVGSIAPDTELTVSGGGHHIDVRGRRQLTRHSGKQGREVGREGTEGTLMKEKNGEKQGKESGERQAEGRGRVGGTAEGRSGGWGTESTLG